MKKIALGLAIMLLVSCVYIGAYSVVTGQKMRPPTLAYILEEITSYKYFVNVQDSIKQIENIWNANPSADMGGGENGGVGSTFDDDTPEWLLQLSLWLEESVIGRVFLTISSVVELVVLAVYDVVLAILYIFKIMSVFLTGVPV